MCSTVQFCGSSKIGLLWYYGLLRQMAHVVLDRTFHTRSPSHSRALYSGMYSRVY